MPAAWKRRELAVAKKFHCQRRPGSGAHGERHGGTDDIKHPTLYVEVKQRKAHGLVGLYRETEKRARKEKKRPVVVASESGKPGLFVILPLDPDVLEDVAACMRNRVCPDCEVPTVATPISEPLNDAANGQCRICEQHFPDWS